jgi:hypothetical protein
MIRRSSLVFSFLLVVSVCLAVGQQIDFLASGLTDPAGHPLAGGKVYTYAAGTLAPKSTFAEASLATPNTNPIILDPIGRCLAFGDGRFKFIIQTASGSTLYTWDGLSYKSVIANAPGTAAYSGFSTAGQTTISVLGYTDVSTKPNLYIGGIKQALTTYTWTSQLVTLTDGAIPIAGIQIEVIF